MARLSVIVITERGIRAIKSLWFGENRTRTRNLCLALAIGVAVAATSVSHVEAFHTRQHLENSLQRTASLSDVIVFVQRRGWSVDLGFLCKGLALKGTGDKCLFRQIAIHAKTAELDDHGFNVPIDEFAPSYAVIYHVSPLAGEFFLVSKEGKLLKAIFRARGQDFEPMSDERGSTAFAAELAFWQNNFAQIEHDTLQAK